MLSKHQHPISTRETFYIMPSVSLKYTNFTLDSWNLYVSLHRRLSLIRNRIQKPVRAWKMLKNESARNPTKPTPLRPDRLPNSGGIIFMSNGVHMEKISRFDRKVKQVKKVLTGQSVQSVQLVQQRVLLLRKVIGLARATKIQTHCSWSLIQRRARPPRW